MTIIMVRHNAPYFIGLSTDISLNTFSGAKSFYFPLKQRLDQIIPIPKFE